MSDGLRDALKWNASSRLQDEYDPFDLSDILDEPTVVAEDDKTRRRFLHNEKVCVCGSRYTTTPNLHLRWCDLFVDPMGPKT